MWSEGESDLFVANEVLEVLLSNETPSAALLALGKTREESADIWRTEFPLKPLRALKTLNIKEFPLMFNIFVKQVIKLFCKCAVITINTL